MLQSAHGARLEYLGTDDELAEAFGFVHADVSEPYYASITGLILDAVAGLARGARSPVPVADIGAGVGRVACDVARSEWASCVYAVESSPELLREIKALASGEHRVVMVPVTSTKTLSAVLRPPGAAPKLRALEGDAHALPLPDASVSCAVALGLLDRLEHPRAFTRELARVVEPGGVAIVSCLHDFSGGPAKESEWVDSIADAFDREMWAACPSRNQRLDLRQNARYSERFNAEIVVLGRSGEFRRASPSR